MNLLRKTAFGVTAVLPQRCKHLLEARFPLSRRLYAAMLRSAGDTFTTTGGPAAGIRWHLSPHVHRLVILGRPCSPVQAALVKRIRPGWVVYDLGANIGFYSLLMAKLVGATGKVLAFEPGPDLCDELRHNVALNAFCQVEVLPYAVADQDGAGLFQLGNSPLMGALVTEATSSAVEVQCRTLDHLVFGEGRPVPNLIKMNVEGAEAAVLAGGRRLFLEHRPILVCEVHSRRLLKAVQAELGPAWIATQLTQHGEMGYYVFDPAPP